MAEPRKYKSSKRGEGRTQKRIGVAIDSELEDWLNTKPNKNRYINELIRQDMTRHKLIITTAGKPEIKLISLDRQKKGRILHRILPYFVP